MSPRPSALRFHRRLLAAAVCGCALAVRAASPLPPDAWLDRLTVAACSLPNTAVPEALATIRALGFAGVELAVFADNEKVNAPDRYPWVVADTLDAAATERMHALLAPLPLRSAHLPYGKAMRPLAPDPAIRAAARRELHRALGDAARWGARVANVHVLTEDGLAYAAAKPQLVALYRELGDAAARLGLRLAIETTRPYAAADYLDLVAAVDHPAVGGCIDTGHTHFFPELAVKRAERDSPESVRAYNDLLARLVAALGPKLFHVHLDDVRRLDWREHFVPGTGIIDWVRFFRGLEAVNYRGALVLELLYYVGADDRGAMLTRAFTQRTPDGAAEAGLRAARGHLEAAMAAARAAP